MFSKKQIDQITLEKILKYGQPAEVEYNHRFFDNIYIREMKAKKNSFILGGKHLKFFPLILINGKVLIFQNDKKEVWSAPYYSTSCIGHYRFIYGLEDYTLISIHYTDKKSLNLIEAENCLLPIAKKGILKKELLYEFLECGSICSRNVDRLSYECNASPSTEENAKES